MPIGVWTQVGPRKHVLDGVNIGATWQVNSPCAVAIRPFIILLWQLVFDIWDWNHFL